MKTQIYIWSKIGHCPLTNRQGAFCDELMKEVTDCTSPEDAAQYVHGLIKHTPHAEKGYFIIPEWWNQNTRSNWVS